MTTAADVDYRPHVYGSGNTIDKVEFVLDKEEDREVVLTWSKMSAKNKVNCKVDAQVRKWI